MSVETVAVFLDRYFDEALRFDSLLRALRISSGITAGAPGSPGRKPSSPLPTAATPTPTGTLPAPREVVPLHAPRAAAAPSGPASRRSDGTDDEWVELECIDSPEQIEDESKASSASVSACTQAGRSGRKVCVPGEQPRRERESTSHGSTRVCARAGGR